MSVTLLGLRRVGALLQRWGCRARRWCSQPARVRRQVDRGGRPGRGAELRGLDRQEGDGEDRIALVVKLRPRYRTEQLLDVLGRLDGVRQVEWER
jgi:hypothetical protein